MTGHLRLSCCYSYMYREDMDMVVLTSGLPGFGNWRAHS